MSDIAVAKVEDYKIVSCNNHARVNREILEFITKGYQPWGELSVVVSPASNVPIFTQVMVKYNALWPDA